MSNQKTGPVKPGLTHEELGQLVRTAETASSAHAASLALACARAGLEPGSKLRDALDAYIDAAKTKEALESQLKEAKEDCKAAWSLVQSASWLQPDMFDAPALSAEERLANLARDEAWLDYAQALARVDPISEQVLLEGIRGTDRARVQGMCACLWGQDLEANPYEKPAYQTAWINGGKMIEDFGHAGAWRKVLPGDKRRAAAIERVHNERQAQAGQKVAEQ